MKKIVIIVLVLTYAVGTGYYLARYNHQAPERTASSFINDLTTKGNTAVAYNMTSQSFQQLTSTSDFASFVQPLVSSKAKYTVSKQYTLGHLTVVNGVVQDLNGANYAYDLRMVKQSGNWVVDSIIANKQ